MKGLERNIALSGLALVQFANYPLEAIHPLARTSAEAMECARREQLGWQLHDRLFELSAAKALSTRSDVDRAITSVSSGDASIRIAECVTAGAVKSSVTTQTTLARVLGVQSTPTFVLGLRKGSAFFPKKRIRGTTTADAIANELRQITEHQ
jgi:protein-disulfide isomerase